MQKIAKDVLFYDFCFVGYLGLGDVEIYFGNKSRILKSTEIFQSVITKCHIYRDHAPNQMVHKNETAHLPNSVGRSSSLVCVHFIFYTFLTNWL